VYNEYLTHHIKRSQRHMLLSGIGLLILFLGAGYLFRRWYVNVFFGPFRIDPSVLSASKNPDDHFRYFIKVKGKATFDSGAQVVDELGEPVATYLFLDLGPKLLLVQAPMGEEQLDFRGLLAPLKYDHKEKIIDPLLKERPDLKEAVLPFLLDAISFRCGRQELVVGLSGVAVFIVAIWCLVQWQQRKENPYSHPIIKTLEKYGYPPAVADEVERDVNGEKEIIANATLGKSWMMVQNSGALEMLKYEALVWVYKIVTKRSFNLNPNGKSFSVRILTKFNDDIYFYGEEPKCDKLIESIHTKAPWAFVGFSTELENFWNKNRPVFINEVEKRKSKRKASPPNPD
jgi:hypothetical protein